MKTMILLALVSTTAFAQMTLPVMPRLPHAVLKIDQVSDKVQAIEVNNNGNVIVYPRLTRNLVIFKLSPTNKTEILSRADYLGRSEIETKFYEVVCMAIQDPNTLRQVLMHNPETGEFRLVLSAAMCSHSATHPKYVHLREDVVTLRSEIIAIVNQKLNL